MLTRPGEFMLRISEGTPGALAFSYRPAKPPQNNPSGIMHTRVYPTSTGYVNNVYTQLIDCVISCG